MSLRIWTVWECSEEERLDCSFTTPELADAHATQLKAIYPGDSYRVEEEEVMDRLPQRVEFHARQGRVDPAGLVHHGPPRAYLFWDTAPPPELHLDDRNRQHHGVTVMVWHRNPAEAQRIYEDQVAALVAEGSGAVS